MRLSKFRSRLRIVRGEDKTFRSAGFRRNAKRRKSLRIKPALPTFLKVIIVALDLEKYRNKLLKEQKSLNESIGSVSEISQPISDNLEVTAENAQNLGEINDVQTTVAGMKSDRLEKINAALQRIDDGTYGICSRCNKPIDPRRLDVEPEATTCMDCLSAEEANFQAPTM
jgi:RNA polymerase-binding transcription factor